LALYIYSKAFYRIKMARFSTLYLLYLVNLTCFAYVSASEVQPWRAYRAWRLGMLYFLASSCLVRSLLLFGTIFAPVWYDLYSYLV
jgi:hypothetical protein